MVEEAVEVGVAVAVESEVAVVSTVVVNVVTLRVQTHSLLQEIIIAATNARERQRQIIFFIVYKF